MNGALDVQRGKVEEKREEIGDKDKAGTGGDKENQLTVCGYCGDFVHQIFNQ